MAPQLSASPTPEQIQYLCALPAVPPLIRAQPKFINPESQNQAFYIESSILFAVVAVLLTNRGYFKVFIKKTYTWDDRELRCTAVCTCANDLLVTLSLAAVSQVFECHSREEYARLLPN